MTWRLLVALILALYLVPIGSYPVAAQSAEDLFNITYEVSLSKTEINGSEVFYATIQGEARCKEDLEFPYNLVSEARITGRVTATHQAIGAKVTLNSSYTVTIDPFPTKKDDFIQSRVVVSLQFPDESQSGIYSVVGEPIEAKVNTLIGWFTVTSYLPSSQTMGSVTYVAPDGGRVGGGGGAPPTAEEVETNLFGTETSSPISSSGEILETIEATSEDGMLTLTIPEGTIALDKDDNSLITLEAQIDTSPPPSPEDTSIIGLAYDFGPDGATFDPSITLTRSYDPNDIPEGVAEEDLVLAWYDEASDQWIELDCVVYTGNNTITAAIEHFTTFAIIGAIIPLEPVEPVLAPAPAAFTPSSLGLSPIEVNIGDEVTISLLVANTGGKSGSYRVTLKINGVVAATKEVTVSAGFSKEATFTISKDIAGTYSVDVNGLTDSFTVKEEEEEEVAATPTPIPPTSSSDEETSPSPSAEETSPPPPAKEINRLIVYGVVATLVAMGVLLFFLVRRSHTKSSS